MKFDADSSFSRLPRGVRASTRPPAPQATRGQKALEFTLFAIFGLTLALAGVALYATNRPEHSRVPNRFASGIQSDRLNVLLIGSSIRTEAQGGTSVRIESLMLLSVQPSSGRAALMSVPVDLWAKVGRYGNRPLRTAHVVGDASGYPGAGVGLTVDTISDIVDEPIHAYARVSLGDLRRVIDSVGGIDVNITRGVYEYRAQQRFRPGTTRLNGLQATRYAYSPNVAGAAAADRFAREDRQQAVFIATLLKVLDENRTIAELRDPFGSLTATNLEPQHLDVLRTALRRGGKDIRRISFAPHLDTYDVTSVVYRGEALVPRNGNFATLQRVADAALDTGVARVN